jgi:phage-related protein
MQERPIEWMGSSLEDLRSFPPEARTEAGHELFLIQRGEPPGDWKPLPSVGRGAKEIRVHTWAGGRLEHRVVYVAHFPEAVYVLHAFRKTTGRTSRQDLETARRRYREMLNQRSEEE